MCPESKEAEIVLSLFKTIVSNLSAFSQSRDLRFIQSSQPVKNY